MLKIIGRIKDFSQSNMPWLILHLLEKSDHTFNRATCRFFINSNRGAIMIFIRSSIFKRKI